MNNDDENCSMETENSQETSLEVDKENEQIGFHLKTKKLIMIAIAILIGWLIFDSDSTEKKAVLLVRFSETPTTDIQLIENALKIGGLLDCGSNQQYVNVIKSIDEDVDKFGAKDSKGSYYIMPAVLNWISSKGWKFQQKFCINLNNDNAEYYFTK